MFRSLQLAPFWFLFLLLSACEAEMAPVADSCEIVPPDQPAMCTMQYDPVCGCDGKTYSNACVARNAGVPRMQPGACEERLD